MARFSCEDRVELSLGVGEDRGRLLDLFRCAEPTDLADLPDMTDQLVDSWAEGLAREVLEHAERVTLETDEAARLRALGVPVLELPRLAEGIDLGSLYGLAERLREQGVRGWDGRMDR